MSRLIAVEINPADDGWCGECAPPEWCDMDWNNKAKEWVRGPLCLEAEARISTIKREARVEALRDVERMTHEYHANTVNESQRKQSAAILGNINAMIAKEEA